MLLESVIDQIDVEGSVDRQSWPARQPFFEPLRQRLERECHPSGSVFMSSLLEGPQFVDCPVGELIGLEIQLSRHARQRPRRELVELLAYVLDDWTQVIRPDSVPF
jgi:hypothetical protein